MKTITAAEYRAGAEQPRRRKYGNKPVTIDGERFDSIAEAARWATLQLQQRAGLIAGLRRQPRYDLHAPGGQVIGQYVGDAEYVEVNGGLVCEDTKSPATAADKLFRWKAKHMDAEHGIKIRLVGKGVA
jgi:hypothetical protein